MSGLLSVSAFPQPPVRAAARGFSLAELMVVLAIAAILIAVALPDLRGLFSRHQLDAAVSDLFNAVDLARSEALARGARVQLAPAGADGADWSSGWIVFVDSDGDRRPGPADEIITMHGAVPAGIIITSVFTSQKVPYYIAYNGAGRSCSNTSSLAARWGTLSLTQATEIRRIRINMLGRARICDPAREGATCGASD